MKKSKKSISAMMLLIIYVFLLIPINASATLTNNYAEKTDIIANKSTNIDISSRIYESIFGKDEAKTNAKPRLIVGGDAFGIKINEQHPRVCETNGKSELKIGDLILELNGKEISSYKDVDRILSEFEGVNLQAKILRDGKETSITLHPDFTDGKARLNVSLKQSNIGIGTITFINPYTNEFGGLGHGVCDTSGELFEVSDGVATSVIITGVKRGTQGKPGELCGALGKGVLGEIRINSHEGVFGRLNCEPLTDAETVEIGERNSVKIGKAQIISTLKNGKKATYDIEITDVDYTSDTSKSFKIKVTDEALIAISGGIVRGMSGSPIIQDGKLVGAVTHVMVANPTEGYGIFIENMLNAANNQSQQKAA